MRETIHIVLASDSTFFYGLQTTLASLVFHERSHPLQIHVLDGGLQASQWRSLLALVAAINPAATVNRHVFNPSSLAGLTEIRELGHMTYARLFAASVVEADLAIYLDSDFLITRPLSGLLQHYDTDKAVSGVIDFSGHLSDDCPWGGALDLSAYTYINGGLLLLNVKRWKSDRLAEALLAFIQKESARCRYADQSAINWVLKGQIGVLPPEWNAFGNSIDAGSVEADPGQVNIHYASGLKPWKRPLPTLSHKLWWKFTRSFVPHARMPNPFINPRNLLRYARRYGRGIWSDKITRRDLGASLEKWKAFWRGYERQPAPSEALVPPS
ncbi:MAG: glycosyltransferase [bacterium]